MVSYQFEKGKKRVEILSSIFCFSFYFIVNKFRNEGTTRWGLLKQIKAYIRRGERSRPRFPDHRPQHPTTTHAKQATGIQTPTKMYQRLPGHRLFKLHAKQATGIQTPTKMYQRLPGHRLFKFIPELTRFNSFPGACTYGQLSSNTRTHVEQ